VKVLTDVNDLKQKKQVSDEMQLKSFILKNIQQLGVFPILAVWYFSNA